MSLWSWIRRDGLLHIESCALLAVISGFFVPWWASGLIAFAIGLGKEIWDTKHGVANWHDVICDFAGAAIGMLLVIF